MNTRVKTSLELKAMRQSGRMLATVLDVLKAQAQAGMTTKDLAIIADRELKVLGGKPAFLGYQGFPDVICISLNQEVVHGIPSAGRVVEDGDILSLDFGVNYQGMITDGAISMIVGKPRSQRHVELVRMTESAMLEGIAALHNGVRVGDIGAAVQSVLAKGKFGNVRDLVGHGVGHELHEDPNIPNYGKANTGPWLQKGMTIAIEPMATLGTDRVFVAEDGWTIITQDGSWSAHFEHTALITENGAEIMTQLS